MNPSLMFLYRWMLLLHLHTAAALAAMLSSALADYAGWQHSGELTILTTPEGPNLAAGPVAEAGPVLVRLDKGWFDFTQTKPDGADVRFATVTDAPMAYQIDDWNVENGTASAWVRVPKIEGNARQTIRTVWGTADAASESDGKAVFDESNDYVAAFHLEDDPRQDKTGTLAAKDQGTTPSGRVISRGRHFAPGKGIDGSDEITTFPTGAAPPSTEVWFRAEKSGDRIVCWGSGGPKTMVQMILSKRPTILMDSYGASASLWPKNPTAMNEWVHVIQTCKPGGSGMYVKGVFDAGSLAEANPLEITNPVKPPIGRLGNLVFKGGMDEVRISKVARSADWVRLQYENQKPLQTSVGPLGQPGGAQKIDWIIKRAQNSRTMTVTAVASNGGREHKQSLEIAVKEPVMDAWAQRIPDKDEKPVDNQSDLTHTDSPWFRSFGGMALAKKLAEDVETPIFIINGAVGGTRIDEHMPQPIRKWASPWPRCRGGMFTGQSSPHPSPHPILGKPISPATKGMRSPLEFDQPMTWNDATAL